LAGGGFSFARAVGEMTWAVAEVIGAGNLVRYESELNGSCLVIRRSCCASMISIGSAATCSSTSAAGHAAALQN
jgi:hypothetical protein